MAKTQFQWDGKTYEFELGGLLGPMYARLPDGTTLRLSDSGRPIGSVALVPATEVVKHRFVVEFTGVPDDKAVGLLDWMTSQANSLGYSASFAREAK
jgi:hypothetical protein